MKQISSPYTITKNKNSKDLRNIFYTLERNQINYNFLIKSKKKAFTFRYWRIQIKLL